MLNVFSYSLDALLSGIPFFFFFSFSNRDGIEGSLYLFLLPSTDWLLKRNVGGLSAVRKGHLAKELIKARNKKVGDNNFKIAYTVWDTAQYYTINNKSSWKHLSFTRSAPIKGISEEM